MTSAADILDDAGYDFDDVAEAEPVGSGHLSRPRGDGDTGTGTSRSAGPGTGTRPRRRASVKRTETLQKKLSGEMFAAGAMIGFPFPVTGYYIGQESDAFTKAIVELASHRAEWIDALEHIAAIQPGIVVGRTAFGIGAALAVDRGRADPDKKVMMALGVYTAWKAVQDKKEPGEAGENATSYKPPPVSFRPVGVSVPANA